MKNKRGVLLLSHFLSNSLDRGVFIYFCWLVMGSGGTEDLNLLVMAFFLPNIMFFIFVGRGISVFGPAKVLFLSNGLKFCCFLTFSIFVYLGDYSGFYGLAILAFTNGIGSTFFNPAAMALPALVEANPYSRRKLNSMLGSSLSFSTALAPLLAALFIFMSSTDHIYVLCFISTIYFVSLLAGYLGMKSISKSDQLNVENLKTSPFVIKQYPVLMWLLGCFLIVGIVFSPLPYFIPLKAGSSALSDDKFALVVFELCIGLGSILGSLVVVIRQFGSDKIELIPLFFILSSFFYFTFGVFDDLYYSSISLFLLGASLSLGNILSISYYQHIVREEHVSSVMTIFNLCSVSVAPISILASGLSVQAFGLDISIISCALVMLVASIMMFFASIFTRGEECELL